jgi:20S proteasome alpha/beta subunit
MTIVAGFTGKGVLEPGVGFFADRHYVVLGADSEESGGYIKSAVRKVATVDKGDCKCLIAGAGSGDFIDFAIQESATKLSLGSSLADIRRQIEAVVSDIYATRIAQYPPDEQREHRFELLCGIWVRNEGVQLVRVTRAVSLVLDSPATIGIGADLARYIIDSFNYPNMTLYHATRLTAYLLSEVKKHVPMCGGTSQVVWMDETGKSMELLPGSVGEHERSTALVMSTIGHTLLHFADPMGWGFNLSRVDVVVDDAAARLKEALKEGWGPLHDMFSSPPPAEPTEPTPSSTSHSTQGLLGPPPSTTPDKFPSGPSSE